MDFWQHLKATGDLDLQGITEGLSGRLSALTSRGHSVADLLLHYGEEFGHLPAERLRALVQAHRAWGLWRRRKTQLEDARKKAKLPPLPEAVHAKSPYPDQLDAIVRTARLAPRQSMASETEWITVLTAGVELWSRGLALTRKHGRVKSRARDLAHPEAAAYDPYVRLDEPLEEIAPHRWLAMRRGERAKVLELTIEVPREELLGEVSRYQAKLGPVAAERTAESLLQELILDDLTPWLLRLLDNKAQAEAIKTAAESFSGLLRTPPLQCRALGGVYLTRAGAPLAAVVLDREGDLQHHLVIKATGPWQERVNDFFAEQGVQHVVLPTSCPVPELLAALEARLSQGSAQVVKVRAAALAEARQPLVAPPHRLSPTVASAVVLTRRALDPLKEWSLIDPVAIGIAEYGNDLEAEQLRAVLQETAELCRLERRRGKRVHLGGAAPRGSAAMARLNPLVKSLADLRPGMSVHGVVTNISHFGAFVNLGLPQEALVHISELSDHFITNPNEVVSIGQQVTAHILAVDPSRARISLSLKNHAPGGAPLDRGERPRGPRESRSAHGLPDPGRSRRSDAPISKAQALANLEKLFKK